MPDLPPPYLIILRNSNKFSNFKSQFNIFNRNGCKKT